MSVVISSDEEDGGGAVATSSTALVSSEDVSEQLVAASEGSLSEQALVSAQTSTSQPSSGELHLSCHVASLLSILAKLRYACSSGLWLLVQSHWLHSFPKSKASHREPLPRMTLLLSPPSLLSKAGLQRVTLAGFAKWLRLYRIGIRNRLEV